jgi:hypothetical protein
VIELFALLLISFDSDRVILAKFFPNGDDLSSLWIHIVILQWLLLLHCFELWFFQIWWDLQFSYRCCCFNVIISLWPYRSSLVLFLFSFSSLRWFGLPQKGRFMPVVFFYRGLWYVNLFVLAFDSFAISYLNKYLHITFLIHGFALVREFAG